MRSFQDMCNENFGDVRLLKRGGQKVVYHAKNKSYGECVIKLYFQLNDPHSLREYKLSRN